MKVSIFSLHVFTFGSLFVSNIFVGWGNLDVCTKTIPYSVNFYTDETILISKTKFIIKIKPCLVMRYISILNTRPNGCSSGRAQYSNLL